MLLSRRLALTVAAAALLAAGGIAHAQSLLTRRPGAPRLNARQAPQPVAPACGPTSLTESSGTTVTDGNSVSCNTGGFHADNHYWRAFTLTDLGIESDFNVCEVTIGVEDASSVDGSQPITINLYTSDPAFPAGTLTLIGTSSTTVSDQSLSLATFPIQGTAPKGSQLVVEIFTPSGIVDLNRFVIGSNSAAETAPSYISAPDCGIPDPTTTADAGHPDMHIVMVVDGTAAGPVALAVDPAIGIIDENGNGVLELNETALIVPSWTNGGLTDFSLTGVASNLTGTFGPLYLIDDPTSDYGTITAGTSKACFDCYSIEINGVRPNGVQHFDVHMDETVTPSPLTVVGGTTPTSILKTWTLHVGGSFADVSSDLAVNPFYPFIETIFHFGVTSGCGNGTTFCPLQNNLRQEMAVFLLKDLLGSGYTPPDCTGVFQDVPCPATPEFPYSNFIEDLLTRGITTGCDVGPPALFCPGQGVTRAQMAPFLLKASQGSDYVPPACTGHFTDVPCPATPEFPFSDYVEDLSTRGITAGCDLGPPARFCPDDPVTRDQMAVFLSLAFNLSLYGP